MASHCIVCPNCEKSYPLELRITMEATAVYCLACQIRTHIQDIHYAGTEHHVAYALVFACPRCMIRDGMSLVLFGDQDHIQALCESCTLTYEIDDLRIAGGVDNA